jgi:catechol 2,3-dioxygenase-like lactoylglutathione lyase family enzyme
MLDVLKLGHAEFKVRDLDRMVEFYSHRTLRDPHSTGRQPRGNCPIALRWRYDVLAHAVLETA